MLTLSGGAADYLADQACAGLWPELVGPTWTITGAEAPQCRVFYGHHMLWNGFTSSPSWSNRLGTKYV